MDVAISLKDLARLAGVSVSTVTRALQDKPDVNRKTRQKVLELAKQHHYRPNILARSLVTSRTYTVGVVVPDLANPFFPALIKGVESALWTSGYTVILADTNFDVTKEKQAIEELIARSVDGLIVSPIDPHNYHDWMDSLRAASVPVVALTRLARHDADVVCAADRYGARSAVEHLLSIGRNRIAYIGNESSEWANTERIAGVREAFAAAGVPLRDGSIQSAPAGTMDAGREAAARLIANQTETNAIIAFDDYMALGVRAALQSAGLRVPEDIALVGFDNIELSSLPDISLTTIDIPKLELGRVSAQLATERIEELALREESDRDSWSPSPFKEIVLKTELVVRRSTRGVAELQQ